MHHYGKHAHRDSFTIPLPRDQHHILDVAKRGGRGYAPCPKIFSNF